jgi:hypothetical protein
MNYSGQTAGGVHQINTYEGHVDDELNHPNQLAD